LHLNAITTLPSAKISLLVLPSTADHFEWDPIDDFRFFHINAGQHTETTPCVARDYYRCEYTDEINLGTCGTANRRRKIYLSRLPVRLSTSAFLHLEEQDSNTNLPHTARINPKMNTTKQTWRREVERWVMDFDISDAAFSALMGITDPGRELPTAARTIQHSPETIASTMHSHLPNPSTMDTGHALHAGSYSSCQREDPTSAPGQPLQRRWQLDATPVQPQGLTFSDSLHDASAGQPYDHHANHWPNLPDLTSQSNLFDDHGPRNQWLGSPGRTLYPCQSGFSDDLPVTTMTPFFDGSANRPSDFSNATWHSVPDNDDTEQANALSNDESHGFSSFPPCSRSGVLSTTMKRKYSRMDKDSEDDPEMERTYLPASSAVINFHENQRYIPGHAQSKQACLRCRTDRTKV
jgi:hypothetical protein